MRRILLLVVGMLAVAIAAPSVASAHGRHHHHKGKHARHFGAKANALDPASPDAGTVDAFADGTLTIRLASGSTVSGAVDDDTVINCIPAQPTAMTAHHDEGDDDQGDDDQGDGDGDRHHGHCGGQSACDATDLVPGAVVHVAILKLGSDGPEFKLVLLRKSEA
ncbi:MAG TPA: hypothetical protein VFG31_02015 [Conexibacter sp.]|nr:hypothetical protein [Conexibacter sp.]